MSLTIERTYADLVAKVAATLDAAGVPSPAVDARWLVTQVVEVAGDPTVEGAAMLDELVARRAAREPLQLVVGHTAFRTLELTCAPGVFIPRPETEVVAGEAISCAQTVRGRRARIIDACTGTGAIALSVAAEVPDVAVIATDIDERAVDLARANLDSLRDASTAAARTTTLAAGATVDIRRGRLLDPVPASWRGRVDVLVSNPPYLPAADRAQFPPEVADHDPDRSLVGGPDGHEIVDELLQLAAVWLAPGGTVVIEIDERRGADAAAHAAAVGLEDVRLLPDLTGVDRAIVARRSGTGEPSRRQDV